MKKLLALLAVLGLSNIVSAAVTVLPLTGTVTQLTDVTNTLGTFERYRVTVTSDGTNKYSGADAAVTSVAGAANVLAGVTWTPVSSSATSTYTWADDSQWYPSTTDYYAVTGATSSPTLQSSSVTGFSTSSLYTGTPKIGAQEASFSGLTSPTYTFVANEDEGTVGYTAAGGSTTGLASYYHVASAISTDTLSNIMFTVYVLKGTQGKVDIQTTNGAGIKSDVFETVVGTPEPATLSLLAIGLAGLLRRKLA
jgi:hypothetical protein